MKIFKFKHPRRVYLYVLLSFLMCMLGASSVSGRTPRNPIVKLISGPTYSDNGTEVTLKLWMYNYDGDNAHFIGDVNLCIDGAAVCKLNDMWSMISNVYSGDEKKIKGFENSGNVGSKGTIILNSEVVGNAQFRKAQKDQKCPDNSNTGKWTTIELQLSFNNSFSYRKHTVSVKGNWRDRCDDKNYSDKIWDIQNTLHGFVYPTKLDVSRLGRDIKFTWEYSGSETDETRKGKWVLYRIENGKCVKQVEDTSPFTKYFTIPGKDFRCLATYYLTFQPNALNETTIIAGLTKGYTKGSHDTDEGVCQFCKHGIFSYTTADGKAITFASNIDFGSKILSHTVDNNGKCIIEFEGKFTRIPDRAFLNTKINSHNIKIPNTVTSIGSYAFKNTAISGYLAIPNSVTEIGDGAFSNCSSFYGLTLSNKLTKIGNQAFMNCNYLRGNLTIPNSVTEIGKQAFQNCTGFKGTLTLSNKLETIGELAFYGCSFTGSLTLPSSVTTIGQSAFMSCHGFTKLELPNTLSVIPGSAFRDCEGLSGSLVIPDGVKEIGASAFSGCTGFDGTLTLSNKLETIGGSAFNGCTGFTGSLTLPSSVTTIGQSAFSSCYGFTKLELPNTLSVIPIQAFMHCRSLSGELVIPASVTEIGNNAFYGCQNLSAVTGQVTLPKSLKKIGKNVFLDTDNINTVNFQSLPEGISGDLGKKKKAVSLSDDSYISDQASGTVDEISYTRQMSNNWGTLVLPYSLTLTGDESYRLYAIDNMTGEELVLKQLNGEVGAGIPYVVKRKGSEAELTFGNNYAVLNTAYTISKRVGNMYFSGTFWTKDVDNGYIIAKDCFWNVEKLKGVDSVKAVKVGPFRAWLDGTSPNGASQLSICVSDTATGIDAAGTIDALNDTATEYYDLSGKRLDEPQRGVNIVRMKSGKTKKIIIK